jgi:pimeloyl-ACP methyl ester carboxylesterase
MPRIKIADETIYFAARGESGAPLVFIHGAGGSHLDWNGQLGEFAGLMRTLAPDLPGHGRSTGAGRSKMIEYALVMRDFLDALQLSRAVLVGCSMGGAIAQTLALEFPEYVRGLVLVGTGAKLRVAPEFLKGIEQDYEATARDLTINFFAPDAPAVFRQKSLEQLLRTGSSVTLGDFAACDAFDIRERVHMIDVPTLVLCGREDRMTPVRYSTFLAQQISNSERVVVENAGHMLMLEQPVLFNSVLQSWIAQKFESTV